MPLVDRIVEVKQDIVAWRRKLHAEPELGFELPRTARFVAEQLREFGCDDVATNIGETGVVGVIKGHRQSPDQEQRVIGLRADMDALPIEELAALHYASKIPERMHACGHDGHTAMLLGAARYLAETRNFAGTAVLIFEPGEELGAGAAAMLRDGLMEKFGIHEIYGMHNLPGMPVGVFGIREGAAWAGTDLIRFKIVGRGGHHGLPHECIDPILVGAQLIVALQQILSQNVDRFEAAGLSFDSFHSGDGLATVANTAELSGTIRTLNPSVRDLIIKRIREVADGIAQITGATIHFSSEVGEVVLFNHPIPTMIVKHAAAAVAGAENVHDCPPVLAGDDFARFAQLRPGAYIWCGNGNSAGLHHPAYNFNDEAIPFGTSFWITLVENRLKTAA